MWKGLFVYAVNYGYGHLLISERFGSGTDGFYESHKFMLQVDARNMITPEAYSNYTYGPYSRNTLLPRNC